MRYPLLLVVLLSIILEGCGGAQWRRSEDIVESGWAQRPESYSPPPLYCYRTLANNDCYAKPQKGEETRLEAYYGSSPESRDDFRVLSAPPIDPIPFKKSEKSSPSPIKLGRPMTSSS